MSDTVTLPPDADLAPSPSDKLTIREADTLRAIYAHLVEYGTSPNLGQLANRLGMACGKSAVHHHVTRLRAKGWIVCTPGGRQIHLAGVRMVPSFDGSAMAQRLLGVLDAR